MKHYCIVSLFLVLTTTCFAQEKELNGGIDTNYIKSFRDDLVLTFVGTSAGNQLSSNDLNGKTITYSTNLPTSFGLGIDYKWLTIEYASSFGRTGPPEKGYTDMRSVGFGLTGRKLLFRNFYHQTHGFYLTNPEYINPSFNPATDNYPFRSDVQSTVYYATLNYCFNHRKFSSIASLWQLERQQKSAGSFITGVSFSLAGYQSDSALFPQRLKNNFEKEDAITDFKYALYGVNAGYVHTFAFGRSRKFFLSLGLIPGISFQSGSSYSTTSGNRLYKNTVGLHTEARYSLGYNGDKWYAALCGTSYAVTSTFEGENPLAQGYFFSRIAIGHKFKMKETKLPFLQRLGL